jgi:hypothetical protein
MDLEYLPFSHEELPVKKTFEINGANYGVTLYYNDRFDIYTVTICDSDDVCIFTGKLTYCRNALDAVVSGIDSDTKIIPLIIEDVMREILQVERIDSENFDSVRICVS